LEVYDHASALESAEKFFWQFCDDYLELVKPRAYAAEQNAAAAASAVTALRCALSVLLRLFAPVLPFVTEEAWSWWREGSIHRAAWPVESELPTTNAGGAASSAGLDAAAAAIGAIRKAKSQAKLPQRAGVARFIVSGPESGVDALALVLSDVVAAGHVADVQLRTADGAETRYEVLF